MPEKILTKLFLLLLALLPISFFSCRNSGAPAKEEESIKTPVTITGITFRDVSETVDLPAVSSFLNRNVVRASTSGIIENVTITSGDYVVPGQNLFTIRTRESAALKNTVAGDTGLSIKGLININSSKEGIINTVTYQKGDFVMDGDELAVISDQGSLVFLLEVPVELTSVIESNRSCTLTLPDKTTINGTIKGTLPEIDTETQTVKYMVKPAERRRLPANLIARVRLSKSSTRNAATLPKSAILSNETETEFWVMKLVDDSTAIKVMVTKGYEDNEIIEVKEPLFTAADRILLTGNYGLPDTARVTLPRE